MKPIKFIVTALILVIGLTSCESVRVATDYDKKVNFDQYKTFAFYKPNIDKAGISDLDKRRILRAIDSVMTAKGFTKSQDPDMLIGFFTEATQNVNIYQNNYSWGYYNSGRGHNTVMSTTEGTLYIDLIDASKKELVWQGMGEGALEMRNVDEKIARINEIVREILKRYPPGNKEGK